MAEKKLPAWVQRLTGDLAGVTKHGRQRRKPKWDKRKKRKKMAKASRKKNRR